MTLSSDTCSEREGPGHAGLGEAPNAPARWELTDVSVGRGHGNAADVRCAGSQRPGPCQGAGPRDPGRSLRAAGRTASVAGSEA